jgi:transposase-like protein
MNERPLWTCPKCGRRFANRNQTHTCAPLGSVEDHLAGKPAIVETYRAFEAAARAVGPFEVLAEKTRIAFFARMSFGGAS